MSYPDDQLILTALMKALNQFLASTGSQSELHRFHQTVLNPRLQCQADSQIGADADRVEAAVQQYLYLSFLRYLPSSCVVTDGSGVIQFLNAAASRLLGIADGDVSDRSLVHLVTPDTAPPLISFLSCGDPGPIQTEPVEIEVKLRHSAEEERDLKLNVSRLPPEWPSSWVFCWVLHDITQSKQTERVLQESVRREHWLGAIARQIRQSLDPQDILDRTVLEVQQFFKASRVIIYGADTETPTVTAEAVDPSFPPMLGQTLSRHLCDEWLLAYCQKVATEIDNVSDSPLPFDLRQHWSDYQTQSAIIAPILCGQHLLGWLCLHQCDGLRRWESVEVALIQQVTAQMAIALEQSDRYWQTQKLNLDLEREIERRTMQVQKALDFESTLKRITDKVRDSLDESQILQTVVQELTMVLGLGGCNTALYDLEKGISTISYEYTSFIPAYRGRVAQMNDFPEIYDQLQKGYYFQFCSLIPNPERGLVSLLACPIFVDAASVEAPGVDPLMSADEEGTQEVLGDLWLINRPEHVFNEVEIRLVQQVANQCAIAIRQARLYQAAQGQVYELERLNRLKDEFLSTVSHELRTPISNVRMAIHMLKHAPTEERRQRYLDILETESEREADLINDLLDLQRLEIASNPISVETLPLCEWLVSIVEPFRSRISSHHQQFSLNCPRALALVTTDFQILQRILAELLNNACKYTPAGQQIALSVKQDLPLSHAGPLTTIFQVCNQATIPQSELANIFEKFYRIPNADPWKQGGTGLGLALVLKLVEQLEGTIEATSNGGWTTFTVTIPNRSGADS